MAAVSSMHAGCVRRRALIRVVAADDEPLFRDALARAIRQEPALELVHEAANTAALVAAMARFDPDAALVDAALLDQRVISAARSTRLLVLTQQADAAVAYAAVEAGAAGYVSKDSEGPIICRALIRATRGETVLDPSIHAGIAAEIRLRVRDDRPALSGREHAVLVLIAQGLTAPEIADRLELRQATVKTHQQHLYEKLGVGERAAAVAEAMRKGLIE